MLPQVLMYFGKRYYNAQVGRWTSADSLNLHDLGRGSINLYSYVDGEALKSIDPLGLMKIVSGQALDEYQQNIAPSARKLALSLGISHVGTHRWSSGVVEQAKDQGGAQRHAQGDKATFQYVERIDVIGHTGSGFLTSRGAYTLDPRIAERLTPYVRNDVKIVVHGCGCGITYESHEQFMRALPRGATMYTHDIKSLPGMPMNWVKHTMVVDETSPLGRLESRTLSGKDRVVGEILTEAYVKQWASDQTTKDLKIWLGAKNYIRITDDVRAIMQEAVDTRTRPPEPQSGAPQAPAASPQGERR